MDEKIAALRSTLEQLDRELNGFEIDTAWRQRDGDRHAAIRALCETFQNQITDLVGAQREISSAARTHE